MIKEKIEQLERKDYKVKEVEVIKIISDDSSPRKILSFFSKPIYKENIGFNKSYQTILENKPEGKIHEILTKLNITFYLELSKLNDEKLIYDPRLLLEKITNEVIDVLEINCTKKDSTFETYYCITSLYARKNEINYEIIITMHENYDLPVKVTLSINRRKKAN